MRSVLDRIPFPLLGYLFLLFGFAGLGLTVATLALGWGGAVALGVATVLSYAASVVCFRIRRWQIDHQNPGSAVELGIDPIRGDTARDAELRYLMTYRGADGLGTVTRLPVRPAPVLSERRSA